MPIELIATGSALPKRIVPNRELEGMMDTTDEWIYTHTGVRERRVAVEETTISLGTEAARAAMEQGGVSPDEIDLVICSTVTPDSEVPGCAPRIRRNLGIDNNAPAMDLNANCTGCIYSLATARGLMETLGFRTALVIGSDVLSKIANWEDRGTCILFGDGAGAFILRRSEAEGVLAVHIAGRSDVDDVLVCDWPVPRTPFSGDREAPATKLYMDGHKVFTFAVGALIETVEHTLQKTGVKASELKAIIPHQANARIIKSTARRLDIPVDKFYMNVERVGNTSSASIPIALDELARSGKLQTGDLILLAGFGGGLTYGSALLRWK